MIDFKGALYVTTLAECKTIRSAAEQLYISSPALSMYIKNLESELGVPLFTRDKNRFVPTEIGYRYITCAQQILKINRQFDSELNSYFRRSQHRLSIGLYKRRGISFMVPLLQLAREALPKTEISFLIGSTAEMNQMLLEKRTDLILVTHPIQKEGFIYTYVCSDELLMVCPASFQDMALQIPGCPYPYLPLEKVKDTRLLVPHTSQSIYAYVSQLLSDSGIHFSSSPSVLNMEIAVESVSAHMGVCFTLASYIPSFAHTPSLIFCRPVPKGVPVSWSLACLAGQPPLPELPVLKGLIRRQIQNILDSNQTKGA